MTLRDECAECGETVDRMTELRTHPERRPVCRKCRGLGPWQKNAEGHWE